MDSDSVLKDLKLKMISRFNENEPVSRPHRNRDEELARWELSLLSLGTKNNSVCRTTFLTGNSRSCKTPFEELKPINLRDMKVPLVHHGRYLVCKVIGKPYSIFGVNFPSPVIGVNALIEDLNGDVEEAGIYNFHQMLDDRDWLSPGTILVIKEPCLHYNTNDKSSSLLIESPSDIVFVDPADKDFMNKSDAMQWYEQVSEDVGGWREKGNECFKDGKYAKAVFFYDRAIRCDPELGILYLNKAMACLRMSAYYTAYVSAKIALEKGGDKEKALYRMGQAAYGMRRWKLANDHFLEIQNEFPQNSDALKELKHATARLAEEETGKFNFKEMYESVYDGETLKDKPNVDVADYTGPIQITNIPGKGRGIIALKDIKEGTLLALCKPFGSGYRQDFPKDLIKCIPPGPYIPEHILQVIDTMKKLQNNPQKAKEIYDLYAGDNVKKEEIPDVMFLLYVVFAVCIINVLGVIDAARIHQICAHNPFISDDLYPDDKMGLLNNQNAHLFILPSYFNHACLANAFRSFYGDVIAIHATADIKKGEEIFLTYLYPLTEFSQRKTTITARGFMCECKLCKLDAADPLCSKRNEMLEVLKHNKKTTSPQNEIVQGEPLLKKIRESYTTRKELKVVLAQALVILGSAYYRSGNHAKTLKYLEEVLTLINNPLKHSLRIADICVNIGTCYLNKMNVKMFKKMIKKSMNLCFCDDIDHFKMLYPEIASYLNRYDIH